MKDLENHHIVKRPLRYDNKNDEPIKKEVLGCLLSSGILFFVITLSSILSFFTSCSPKVVTIEREVPVFVYDSTGHNKTISDTLIQYDTLMVEKWMKNDTFFVTKNIIREVLKKHTVYDTVAIKKEVPIMTTEYIDRPVEVIKEVPAKISLFNKIMLAIGYISLLLVVLAIALKFRK